MMNFKISHILSKVLILMIGVLLFFEYAEAQVRVPFAQRTSSYTPDTKIYSIKGDFQLIGNTNMTLDDYSNNGDNSKKMKYVDIDEDPNTLNSSSATLTFPSEGNSDSHCSNIIYAGLYWTGRAHDQYSPNSFPIGGSTLEKINGNSFNDYTLKITSSSYTAGINTYEGTVATYTLTSSNKNSTIIFRFYSWRRETSESTYTGNATVQVGSDPEISLSGGVSNNSSNNFTFTFNSPYCINSGSKTIYINSLQKRRTDLSINTNYLVSISTDTRILNKRQVKLKKAGGTYQTITANAQDIYYPNDSDGYMYSAYAEVTDYVKANKSGEYFVADIALQQGEGGSTGFYGGWGLIVVYENTKMKWRDITIFDGHAYVASADGAKVLSVSGFNTVQQGPVGVKLGLMAGEGDASITGDQFKIRNAENSQWINLSHGANTTTNFFNSSIYTGENERNPKLKNNTGLDISMFMLENEDKSLIKNNQTSTSFQYNSTQDTYIIFCIAMAVDAYIPEIEAQNDTKTINKVSFETGVSSTTLYPNDEIEYTVSLKNLGTEAVVNSKIVIPIPFTASFVNASDKYLWQGNPSMSGTVKYDPSHGATGAIIWDIGYIPLPENKDEILAELTYSLKVTDDCFILNSSCITLSVDGTTTGKGMTSGVSFTNNKFVTGFMQNGTCNGQPIYIPTNFNIDPTHYLKTQCIIPEGEAPDFYKKRKFKYCGLSIDTVISFTDVSPNFPKGSKFYSSINHDENGFVIPAENAINYTSTSGFPIGVFGESTSYYAIPPGINITCCWEFTIVVDQYCSNYWHGSESTYWGTPNNWTAKRVPDIGEDIEFATVANNKNNPALRDLILDTDRIIGNLINNSDMNMVITTGNQLIIDGIVTDENPHGGTIIVKSAPNSPTGTLLFSDPSVNTSVKANIEFINKAYECDSCGVYKNQWQYFGIPTKESVFPYQTSQMETVNQWVETYNGNKWRLASYSDITLKGFRGYEITSSLNIQPTYVYNFSGKLNIGDAVVPITKTLNINYSGINLIGNSFTAAIPITSAAIDLSNVELESNTLYLFNMGTRNQWRKLNGGIYNGIAAGQYQAVPFNLAGQAGIPDRILSMHTFMINAVTSGNIILRYDQLVKNKLNSDETKIKDELEQKNYMSQLPHIVMDVIDGASADRLWLFEHQETTTGFDDGWDGYKLKEGKLIQAYICGSDQSDYQIATVPNIDGTIIGVRPVLNGNYTLNISATPEVELRRLYLKYLFTGCNYPIINNAEYVITKTKSSITNRFQILSSSSPTITNNSKNDLIDISVQNNNIIIENKTKEDCVATIYDLAGRLITSKQIQKNSTTYFVDIAPDKTKIYIINVIGKTKSINKTDRVLLK